uniref:uncharacterized protein LOC120325971 isoform X1 n=1 Tax=Styela clava TaxID=7725 RepID=UPI001939DFA0|nr:uncharacterized protein LOC120325971 isoform X1 [Styela clava]XP_039248095.1 uncharacterized protein LOC120325971 isoform X2 [Styela clava]
MEDQSMKSQYRLVQNPYYQAVSDNPAMNIVIENDIIESQKSSSNIQQRLASQRPRGTRIDETGTRIQVRGGRNYTSRKLHISKEELFDDVVVRGLRADGLSTKLGVKNHKDGIGKLLIDLFRGDSRLPVIEEHYKTHRQKSNCAKTMFATMTHEELQFLKAETFPSRIDVQVRDYLMNAFSNQPEKLQATVEVLEQIQQIFKVLTPHADFLSSHNFQTRGFFLDIILMTCSFLMQIIQDSDETPDTASKIQTNVTVKQDHAENIVKESQSKTAAEILLSVGSDILDNSEKQTSADETNKVETDGDWTAVLNTLNQTSVNAASTNDSSPKTTVMVEGPGKSNLNSEEWTTVEMIDGNGTSRYVLIKTNNNGSEAFDTDKLWSMLQTQGATLDSNIEISLDNQNVTKTENESPEDNVGIVEVIPTEENHLGIDVKRNEDILQPLSNKLTLQLDDSDLTDRINVSNNGNDVANVVGIDVINDAGPNETSEITARQNMATIVVSNTDEDWPHTDAHHKRTISETHTSHSKRLKTNTD